MYLVVLVIMVLKIFDEVGFPIEGNNIEACHLIRKNNENDNSEIFSPKALPKCT